MPQCDFKKRLILVQVDSELQILTFRSAKRTGFLKHSKSDGKDLIWESDGPSRLNLGQNLTTGPIGFSDPKIASVFMVKM